jgi:hypothetical protein
MWLAVVAILLLAAVGAVGGLLYLNRHHPPAQTATHTGAHTGAQPANAPRAAAVDGPSAPGNWRATAVTRQRNPGTSKTGTSCAQWRVRYDQAPSGRTSTLERVAGGHAMARACGS